MKKLNTFFSEIQIFNESQKYFPSGNIQYIGDRILKMQKQKNKDKKIKLLGQG